MQKTRPFARAILILLLVLTCLSLFTPIFDRALRAARRRTIIDHARYAAAEFAVPTALVLAVIEVESDFRKDAHSDAGAMGLMQLMPETFEYLTTEKLMEFLPADAILDPRTNVRYGTCYLAYLFHRFGSWQTAITAYNAGEGRVASWLQNPRYGNADGTALIEIPFPETKYYKTAVLAAYERYSKKYNF